MLRILSFKPQIINIQSRLLKKSVVSYHTYKKVAYRGFSTTATTDPEKDKKGELNEYDKEVVTELMKSINMDELKEFNPKLHSQLNSKPELVLDLKEMIL